MLLSQKDSDCTVFTEVRGAANPSLILTQLNKCKVDFVVLKQKVSKRIGAFNEMSLILREQSRKPRMERAT